MSVLEELRRRVEAMAGPIGPDALAHLPTRLLGFEHEERTDDNGYLGSLTGVVTLWAERFGPLASPNPTLRWRTEPPLIGEGSSVAVALSAGTPPGGVRLYAGAPGIHRVSVHDASDERLLGRVIVSVPYYVNVTIEETVLDVLERTANATGGGTSAAMLIERIRTVAHHALRPFNVRLAWDELGESLPSQFTIPDSGTAPTVLDGLLTGLPLDDTVASSIQLEGAAWRWRRTASLGQATASERSRLGVSEWGVLGESAQEAGASVMIGEALEPLDSLAPIATRLQAATATERATLAPRWIGLALARAVVRGIGVVENAVPVEHDLMNVSPQSPLRDLLGLEPDSSAPSNDVDLVERYRTDLTDRLGLNEVRETPFDALAGFVHVSDDPFAAPASLGSLAQSELLAPLAPAYGGWALRLDDEDASHCYGGAVRDTTERFHIARLQRDLAIVGITLEPTPGEMGPTAAARGGWGRTSSLRWIVPTDWAVRELQIGLAYPGQVRERVGVGGAYADRLEAAVAVGEPGHRVQATGVLCNDTASALRRWRASRRRYPIVAETWDHRTATPHYHDRQIQNLWRAQPPTDAAGRLVRDGRRVLVRDLSRFADLEGDVTGDQLDSLPLGARRHLIGYRDSGFQRRDGADVHRFPGGPNATTSHVQVLLAMEDVLGADWDPEGVPVGDERNRRQQRLSLYKVIAAVAAVESKGYFDLPNASDFQSLSYPLFHYVLGLGVDATRPGELGGLIAFLKSEHERLYERHFARFGVRMTATYGRRVANARGPEVSYASPGKHVAQVRLAHRALRGPGEGLGVLTLRPSGDQFERRGYIEWFRQWPWYYRIVRSLRSDVELRQAVYQFATWRVMSILSETSNGETARDVLESERAVALYLRMHVRGGHAPVLTAARTAGNTQHTVITAMLDEIHGNRTRFNAESQRFELVPSGEWGTATRVIGWNAPAGTTWGGGVTDDTYVFTVGAGAGAMRQTHRARGNLSDEPTFPTLTEMETIAPPALPPIVPI